MFEDVKTCGGCGNIFDNSFAKKRITQAYQDDPSPLEELQCPACKKWSSY